MTIQAAPENLSAPRVNVIGRRVLATVVDLVLFSLLSFALSSMAGTASGGGGSVSLSLEGGWALLFFVLVFGYYVVMEGRWGQTVGKMLLGIKVVRAGTDEAPGLGKAAVRTLLRFVDGLFFYLVAFVAAVASANNRRLGDMAAGTLVVHK